MNVVADRRPIWGRIVGSVDVDLRTLAEGGLQYQRHKMSFWLMLFADLAVGVGAGGVEIAQRHRAQTIGLPVPVKRALDRQFGLAVRVDRKLGRGFSDRYIVGDAIGRASRRE